eukprot:9157258-Lingulodinium_polyedra.AAC.2
MVDAQDRLHRLVVSEIPPITHAIAPLRVLRAKVQRPARLDAPLVALAPQDVVNRSAVAITGVKPGRRLLLSPPTPRSNDVRLPARFHEELGTLHLSLYPEIAHQILELVLRASIPHRVHVSPH